MRISISPKNFTWLKFITMTVLFAVLALVAKLTPFYLFDRKIVLDNIDIFSNFILSPIIAGVCWSLIEPIKNEK